MSTPAQMFDHCLNPVKGFQPAMPWVVDKAVTLKTGITASTAKAGRVVSIDTASGSDGNPESRRWILGTGSTTATSAPLPFLLFQTGTDFDVLGDDGNIVGATSGGTMLSRMMGLACTTAAEVETTEYDSNDTFTPGKLLVADSDGIVNVIAGSGAATVLGVVSDGLITSPHNRSASLLRFHTCYFVRFS